MVNAAGLVEFLFRSDENPAIFKTQNNKTMNQEKQILEDIINAFCLSTQNLRTAHELSGIKGQFFNGKRSNTQLRNLLLRAISNDKAKEIINQMPFPYIEIADRHYIKENTDTWKSILVPLEKKKGNRLECVTQSYTIFYR